MGSGFSKMKKQRKMLEQQFAKMQEEISTSEFTGSAGNGLVTVVLSGEKVVKSVKIKPDCVSPDDVEGLEDLIVAAFKDAAEKAEKASPIADMNPMGMFN